MIVGCRCGCHIGAGKPIGCCQCPRDHEGRSFMNFKPYACHCDCHKAWGSITPPVCVCTCNITNQNDNWRDGIFKTGNLNDLNLNQKFNLLEERLTDLEDWTRKEEDMVHERLKKLEKKLAMVLDALTMIK